jgi:CcmD family protein
MEHFDYLFASYSIIFVAIFAYVMFVWRRQARLESELRALQARLQQHLHAPQPEVPAGGTQRVTEN